MTDPRLLSPKRTPRSSQAGARVRCRCSCCPQDKTTLCKVKARQPYEFGVKVSLAITKKLGMIVGARAFPGNPYDGHTPAEQLEQSSILLQDPPGTPQPKTVLVDLGFRGVDAEVSSAKLIHRGKHKTLTSTQRRSLKRRQAIEPIIGHVKHDHGMRRFWLKGQTSDALHAVLCAAGYNLRWLLRVVVKLFRTGG
jgi:transposase, IS5 family